MLSPFLLLSRIVCTRVTAKLTPECRSKTAGIAKPYQVCNLCHGVLTAFNERQALNGTLFFQILCHRLSCHFPEETTADLTG